MYPLAKESGGGGGVVKPNPELSKQSTKAKEHTLIAQ